MATNAQPMNPYTIFEPLIYSLTGSRALSLMARSARSVEDINQIITGTSPIIENTLEQAQMRQQAERSSSDLGAPSMEDRFPLSDTELELPSPETETSGGGGGFDDWFWNVVGDGAQDIVSSLIGLTGFYSDQNVKDLLQTITAIVAVSQLRDVFGIGEGEFEYAETIEADYMRTINALSAEVGELYKNYKDYYGDLDKLSGSAQAIFERSMGTIRSQAEQSKDVTVSRLASMGLGRSEIAAATRGIDDQVLSQAAVAHQNAEVFNEEIRSRMEQNMAQAIGIQSELNRDRTHISDLHTEMGMQDSAAISDIISSLVGQYYQKPDIYAPTTTQEVTVEGSGGGAGGLLRPMSQRAVAQPITPSAPLVPGAQAQAAPATDTQQAATEQAKRNTIKSVTVDENGNFQIEEMEPVGATASTGQQDQLALPETKQTDLASGMISALESPNINQLKKPKKTRYQRNPETGYYQKV